MRGTGGRKSRAAMRQMQREGGVEGVTVLLAGSDHNEKEHPGREVILGKSSSLSDTRGAFIYDATGR